MNVGIIGLGLIGGSLAKDLGKLSFASVISGTDSSALHCEKALELKLIDEILDLDAAIQKSDLLILCTPVDSICSLLPGILDKIEGSRKLVMDMGSTKADISRLVKHHPGRGRYVAIHPMAGTEFSGPEAAIDRLFKGKQAIICDHESSDADALNLAFRMLETLEMKVSLMPAEDHDIHVAYVSHISHITSFALALSVLDKEKDEDSILSLAAGGFESTVRLAKSNSRTWTPIFLHNAEPVLEVIDNYLEKIQLFRDAISTGDAGKLQELMEEANKIRKILK